MGPAALLGACYALVGITFAWPATHAQAWRLAAWAVSALGFAAHLAYERFRLHNSSVTSALHVAVGAALGAFGLAVGANIHSLSIQTTAQHQRLLLLALGIWPVLTVVPAFLVALCVNVILGRALEGVLGRAGRGG